LKILEQIILALFLVVLFGCKNAEVTVKSLGLKADSFSIVSQNIQNRELVSDEEGKFTFQVQCAKGMKTLEVSFDNAATWQKVQDLDCPESKAVNNIIFNPDSLVSTTAQFRTSADWGESDSFEVKLTQPVPFEIMGAPGTIVNIHTQDYSLSFSGPHLGNIKYKIVDSDSQCQDANNYLTQGITKLSSGKFTLSSSAYNVLLKTDKAILCIVGISDKNFTERAPVASHILKWTQDTVAPTISFSQPASGSYITASNQKAFKVGGHCLEDNVMVQVTVSDAVHSYTSYVPCNTMQSPEWSATFDFSSSNYVLNETNISFTANLQDVAGNEAPSVMLNLVKDTIAPSNISLLLSDAGDNLTKGLPSALSPFTSIKVRVGGEAVWYKYKVGAASTTDCSSTDNYSILWTSVNDIIENTLPVLDGQMRLCVIGKDTAGNEQLPANAKIYDWMKQTSSVIATIAPSSLSSPNKTTSLSFTVGGPQIAKYKAKYFSGNSDSCANPSGYSANFIPISTTLNVNIANPSSFPSNQQISLCVLGQDNAIPPSNQPLESVIPTTWIKDTTPPTIGITAPIVNSYINSSHVSLSTLTFDVNGECSENGRSVVLKDGGNTLSIAGGYCDGTNFSATVSASTALFSQGNHNLSALLTDFAGNATTSATINIKVDTILPSAIIASAFNNTFINTTNTSNSFSITGTCSEPTKTVSLKDGNTLLSSTGGVCTGGNFTAYINTNDVSFLDGNHYLAASITDDAGNTFTSNPNDIFIIKDTLLPSLSINSPVTSSTINLANSADQFAISGACSEGGRTVNIYDGALSLTSTSCTGSNFTAYFNSNDNTISAGSHNFKASTTDVHGNFITSATVTIVKDIIAPSITITSPAGGYINSLTSSSTFEISGTCNEISKIVVIKEGLDTIPSTGGTCIAGGTFVAKINTTSSAFDGLHHLFATLTDSAGNSTDSNTINITKDTLAPIITITSPTPGTIINIASITAYGSNYPIAGHCGADSNGNTVTIKNGASSIATAICNNGDYSTNFNPNNVLFVEGSNTLSATILDYAGNSKSVNVTISKDVTPPTIAITSLANGTYINSTTTSPNYTISGDCSEAGQIVSIEVDSIVAPLTGLGTCDAGHHFSAQFDSTATGITEDSHSLTVTITDIAGNSTTSTAKTFTKDITPLTAAEFSLFEHAQGTNFGLPANISSYIRFDIGISAPAVTFQYSYGTGSIDCAIATYNGTWLNASTAYIQNDFSIQPDGPMKLCVITTDTAGNAQAKANAKVYTWTKQTSGIIAILSPGSIASPNKTTAFNFNVSGTDVAKYSWKLFSDTNSTCDSTAGYTSFSNVSANSSVNEISIDIANSVTYPSDKSVTLCIVGRNGSSQPTTQAYTSATQITWIKDVTPPSLSLDIPASIYINASNPLDPFVITGACSEPGRQVSLRNGGLSLTTTGGLCDGLGHFTSSFGKGLVSEGTAHLSANIIDFAGNSTTSATLDIIKDVTYPTVSITNPLTNSYMNAITSTASFQVSGTCNENLKIVSIYDDNNPLISTTVGTCSGGNFTVKIDTTSLGQASYQLRAHITDTAGNTYVSNPAVTVTKDITPPTLSITEPVSANSYMNINNSASFKIKGNCNESGGTVVIKDGSITLTSTACANPTFEIIPGGLITVGTHHISATLSDAAGNTVTTATYDIIRDITSPNIAISTPSDGSQINSSTTSGSFLVSGSCNEINKVVTLKDNGVELTTTTGGTCNGANFTMGFNSNLGSSTHTYSLTASITDDAGNTTTSLARSVYKDISPLTIAITTPTSGTINSTTAISSFTVAGNCNKDDSSIVLKDGSTTLKTITCSSNAFNTNIDAHNDTTFIQGNHFLSAIITDQVGNSTTSSTINIYKDTSPPTIAITNPSNGGYINSVTSSPNYSVNGTCSEVGQQVTISIGGQTIGTGNCSFPNFTVTINADAITESISTTLKAEISDSAGNTASATNTFTRDITPPVSISLTLPTYIDAAHDNASFSVTGTCSEASAIQNVFINIDGSDVTTGGGVCNGTNFSATVSVSALVQGSHTFKAHLKDAAGNVKTSSDFTITKDTEPPAGLTINTPPSLSSQNQNNYILTGACSNLVGDQANLILTVGGTKIAHPTCSGGTWTTTGLNFDVTTLGDSANISISITQQDQAGNAATTNASTSKDSTPPSITSFTVTSPLVTNPINQTLLNLAVTATDNTATNFKSCLIEKAHLEAAPTSADCSGVWSGLVTTAAINSFTLSGTQGSRDLYLFLQDYPSGNISNYAVITDIIYDSIAPAINSPITSNLSAGTYATGGTLNFTMTLSDANLILSTSAGTAYLDVVIGANTRQAKLTTNAGNNINQITFSYKTQNTDYTVNGISLGSIHMNGSTIKDLAGNSLNLVFTSPDLSGVKLDDPPVIISSPCLTNLTSGANYTCAPTFSDASGSVNQWSFNSIKNNCTFLNIDPASGFISGTPVATGSCHLAFRVFDQLLYSADQEYDLIIGEPLPTDAQPALTTSSIEIYVGTKYTFEIDTNGNADGDNVTIAGGADCNSADTSKLAIPVSCLIASNKLSLTLDASKRDLATDEVVSLIIPLKDPTHVHNDFILNVTIKKPIIKDISSGTNVIAATLFDLNENNLISAGTASGKPMAFKFNVASNVVVSSASINLPSLSLGSDPNFYPANSWLTVAIDGKILGKGGNGGRGANYDFVGNSITHALVGEDGGPALYVNSLNNLNIDINVASSALIAGGGGGGGGGGASCKTASGSIIRYCGGASGGGGGGSNIGLGGSVTAGNRDTGSGSLITDDVITTGTNGSMLSGGAGAISGTTNCNSNYTIHSGNGGAGGDPGQAGSVGTDGYASSCPGGTDLQSLIHASGGVAGFAIEYETDVGLANGATIYTNQSLNITNGVISP
jgi:hypothetical protein